MLRKTPSTVLRGVAAALVVLPCLIMSACGSRAAGYAVVLWGQTDGSSPRTGDVVAIARTTAINSSVLISVTGEKAPREYLLGRLRSFKTEGEAAAFARAFGSSLESWAIVTKLDDPPLPIRDSPGQDGKVVYRLAAKQLVKIVSRSDAPVTVKPYTDYWYEVVTEDGYTGWCFGHYLKEFSVPGDPTAEADRLRSQDDTLALVMGSTWRPDWFVNMAAKGALDLSMFREDVGLFPDPGENMMKLVLPLQEFDFHYTGAPQKQGSASYIFPGTELRIDVLDPDGGRINVTWRQKDQLVTRLYVTMADDVAQIIAAEQKRRADIYSALFAHGSTLSSSAYGTIHLTEDMHFTWQGYSKLVPSLIGPNARGKGTIDLTLHVAKELSSDFDGAITFVFDEYPDAGLSFLYQAPAGGLRLTSLAKDSVQDLTVQGPSASPVVIYFTQSP
jgi:hypothetical protein